MFAFVATEKKNDTCKATYFRSSNKWDATSDILLHEQKLDHLKISTRKKGSIGKINTCTNYIYIQRLYLQREHHHTGEVV